MTGLESTVAVVTGGSKGIGRAVAEALVGRGAAVAIGARTGTEVRRAAEALDAAGPGHARGFVCDVRRQGDCEALVNGAVEAFGHVDVLVNNAGLGVFAPVAEMAPETWLQQIETNLNGVFFCSRAAILRMRGRGGWIINIGSLAGRNAFPGGAAYNATKFGLIGFSEALMQEVRHDGIRVSLIMPGSVATSFDGHVAGEDDDWKMQPGDVARVVLDLLAFPERTLPSRIEMRPSRPPRK